MKERACNWAGCEDTGSDGDLLGAVPVDQALWRRWLRMLSARDRAGRCAHARPTVPACDQGQHHMSSTNPEPKASTPAQRTSEGPIASLEPRVRLLVAMPQSGRTRWLAESASALSTPDGPAGLWVTTDAEAAAPGHMEAVALDALLAIAPTDLGQRVIALDDLHLHPASALEPLADHLEAALDHGAVVLGTSLVVPEALAARWGAARPMRWFRQEDLRVEERTYTRTLVSLGMFARHARRLHRVMDGWAGPLAIAEHRPGPTTGPLTERTLAREAVERAGRDLAPFVDALEPLPSGTSLLPAVSESLLVEALGADDARAALLALRRFLPPADGVDVPLRPHPVLRRILEQAAPPGPDAEQIRQRASAWYLSHDRFTDAIQLTIEDHRPREALDAIRQHQLNILFYDGRQMQRRLMEELPRFAWTTADHLMYAVACLADGDHRQAAFALTTSVMLAADLPPELAAAREVAITYLGMISHPPEICLEAGHRALAALDALPVDTPLPHLMIAEDHRQYRCLTVNHIARNQIVLGDWDRALDTLDGAESSGHPLLDHAAGMFRAWVHGLRGDVVEAQRCAARSLDAADFWPEIHVIAVEARLALFEVHLLQGRIDAALQVANEAFEGAVARKSDHQLACTLVAIAEAELRSGRPIHARAALDRIGDGAYGFVGQRADAIRVRALLADGEDYDANVILRNLPLTQHTILAHASGAAADLSAAATPEEILAWEPAAWRSARHAHQEARAVLSPKERAPRHLPPPCRRRRTRSASRSPTAWPTSTACLSARRRSCWCSSPRRRSATWPSGSSSPATRSRPICSASIASSACTRETRRSNSSSAPSWSPPDGRARWPGGWSERGAPGRTPPERSDPVARRTIARTHAPRWSGPAVGLDHRRHRRAGPVRRDRPGRSAGGRLGHPGGQDRRPR